MKQADSLGVNLSRRSAIAVLAVLTIGRFFPSVVAAEMTVGDVAGLNGFIRLSVFLTQVEQLDQETAGRIYEHILLEPWGKEHLALIEERIRILQLESSSTVTLQQLLANKHFNEEAGKGERWFVDHLLTTWFTGIYYHQSGNYVITYRDALMHVALQNIRPIPGHCVSTFGYWTEPPVSAVQ
ncbi:MAG: Membrane bound containing D-sorbitol dehydrogenase [Pseudomonadota bacterium]|jgi:Membrane bound FAD containing D-sorbitol dehydrogenase